MRKTITALAALTVTASALADYAFYGVLDDAVYQESKVTATSTASKILATKQNKMFSAKDNSRFGVKGDKEFNDGLKGIYQFEVQLDQNGTTLFGNNRTAWVGLEGKAGAVRLGNMDTLVYNVFSAMDVNGRVEYKPQLWRYINGSFVESTSLVDYSDRTRNTLNYTSPAFNGFVGKLVKAYAATSNNANNAQNTGVTSTGTLTTANGKNGQMSGYAVHYDQGPVAARVVRETWVATGMNGPFSTNLQGANASASSLFVAPSLTDKLKREVNAITYDLGVAKLSIIQANAKLADNYVKTTTYGIKVPVGEFSFAADFGTGTYSGTTVGTTTNYLNTGKLKDTTLGGYYTLNKEATLYLLNSSGKNEQLASGTAYTTPGTQKFSALGINYKF